MSLANIFEILAAFKKEIFQCASKIFSFNELSFDFGTFYTLFQNVDAFASVICLLVFKQLKLIVINRQLSHINMKKTVCKY